MERARNQDKIARLLQHIETEDTFVDGEERVDTRNFGKVGRIDG
jgi:hypothetical protein